MTQRIADIAFTEAVKARQETLGSRADYQRQLEQQDWLTTVTDDLAAFLATRTSFYLASVSETGHPYIQHRGGPPGFLKVIDNRTLAFADFAGNRQYISLGNLDGNDRVHLFFMDYANKTRIKLWGRARVVEEDETLMAALATPGYRARPERAIVISIEAWDLNCPQHIPDLFGEEVIAQVAAKLTAQIAELRAENAELKEWMGKR